jgi:DNA-binding IclR family transcriptional regulator
MAISESGAKLNQSVQKAISILRATAAHGNGASVSALARAAGLPRATALRMIQTMESEGLLLRVPQADRVLLGPELVGELCAAVRETVTLSVLAPDGGLDLVHQVDGPHHLVPRSWVGQRFPLHASSSGKLLLSSYDDERLERFLRDPLPRVSASTITSPRALRRELEQIRAQGYATTVDELEDGLAGVSVGVLDDSRTLTGAINISGLAQRLDEDGRRRAIEQTRAVVREIEAALRRGPGRPPGS